jgi:hypothetical protein
VSRGKRTGPPPVKPGDIIEVDKGGGMKFQPYTVTRIVGSRIYFKSRDWEAYVYARSFGRIWRLPIKTQED